MTRHFIVALLVLVVSTAAAQAEVVAISPADAGPDFAIQGEYVGKLTPPDEEMTMQIAIQIIALGDGKFQIIPHMGGLPGQEGWKKEESLAARKDAEKDAQFTLVDGKMQIPSMKEQDISGTIIDGVMKIVDGDSGKTVMTLKKVERKSPTLGAKAPEGAVVLFDGTSADEFKGGRMTDDGLLMEGVTSHKTFGDFTLHIEFLLPFKPNARGQGRGNSGFYAQGRYEVQMLDSFALEGKHNECGGIYSIKDPDINMCFPPLSWQTYDVDFTAARYENGEKVKNARMTVKHNGVTIHDDVELPRTTTAAPVKESADPGPIYLQNHGNPVRYRNIWVAPK